MERSKWSGRMNSPRSAHFGILREKQRPRASIQVRVGIVIVCLAAVALIGFFTALSISTNKGRRRRVDNFGLNSQLVPINVTFTTATEPVETIQTTTQNRIRFPDKTEPYTMPTNVEHPERQGRVMNSDSSNGQVDRRPYYTRPPTYTDDFPQLENYKNGVRGGVYKVMDHVTDSHRQTAVTQLASVPVKFTGVYIRSPVDNSDAYFNGHAYSSDPFKLYKPAHPSEINHLATISTDIETGPRFSNKVKYPPPARKEPEGYGTAGSLTEAIFHPYDEPMAGADSSIYPVFEKRPPARPLKILLDVSMQTSEDPSRGPSLQDMYNLPRKPAPTATPQSNRMIVHLNLYPKKTKKNRAQTPPSTSLVPGNIRASDYYENRNDDSSDRSIEIVEEYDFKRDHTSEEQLHEPLIATTTESLLLNGTLVPST